MMNMKSKKVPFPLQSTTEAFLLKKKISLGWNVESEE